jgi:hypothetical protein
MTPATHRQNIIRAIGFLLALSFIDITFHLNVPGVLDLDARLSRLASASVPTGPAGRVAPRLPSASDYLTPGRH